MSWPKKSTCFSIGTTVPAQTVLLDHKHQLTQTFHAIEEHIADRNLAKVDKLLYTLEDIFDDIEFHLD